MRPPHRDDVPELAAIANNRQIAEMTSRMPYPYNLADAETFIEGYLHGQARRLHLCRYAGRHRPPRSVSAVWKSASAPAVLKSVSGWAKTIGAPVSRPRPANALVDQAFRSTGAGQVHAVCRTVNPRSRNVIVKCGFSFIGLDEIDSVAAGRVPVERYALSRAAWMDGKTDRKQQRRQTLICSQTGM